MNNVVARPRLNVATTLKPDVAGSRDEYAAAGHADFSAVAVTDHHAAVFQQRYERFCLVKLLVAGFVIPVVKLELLWLFLLEIHLRSGKVAELGDLLVVLRVL